MASLYARLRSLSVATWCLLLMVQLIIIGALIWYRPFLTQREQPIAEIPAPSALFSLTEFPVPANGKACMNSVTVTPDTRVATFSLRPAKASPVGGPLVELILTGPGYSARTLVPGGYGGGSATVPLAPPKRSLIATACFVNLGRTTVLLDGTNEPRTVSRPSVEIAGQHVPGDIALSFEEDVPESLLDRLGTVFAHASNLTDGLIPVWLIWLIAPVVAFGVPIALILAFYSALLDDFVDAR